MSTATERRVPTPDEIRAFPATVDVPTAGRCFRLGRDASYDLARTGRFPVKVLRLGRRLVVTRASLMVALDIAEDVRRPNTHASAQVTRDGRSEACPTPDRRTSLS